MYWGSLTASQIDEYARNKGIGLWKLDTEELIELYK